MSTDFSDSLVVGITSRALFDLEEADRVWREQGIEAYRKYMLENEDVLLEPGAGLPLVRALLRLNELAATGDGTLVEVVVVSKNSPETAVRIMKTIRKLGLSISRYVFTGGESVVDYLSAFDVDLFLSTSKGDVQRVIDSRECSAAQIFPLPKSYEPSIDQLRIAFDADAVLFDESSEYVYKTTNMETYRQTEDAAQNTPMSDGPHAILLRKLARLQERLDGRVEYSPVRIAIVTARNAPAELRVITTLRHWGIYVDAAFFLGGVDKTPVLRAFRPHIFFDDQDRHLGPASQIVPSGKVPYPSDSLLRQVIGEAVNVSESEDGIGSLSRSPADTKVRSDQVADTASTAATNDSAGDEEC